MPSSTETYREALAALQARTFQAIIAGEEADGEWMADNLVRRHPVILEKALRPMHADNLSDALGVFFPSFVAKAPIRDWGKLSPYLPTTGTDDARLEHYAAVAFGALEGAPWQDLIRIEWAEYTERNREPIQTPERVAKVRALDALVFDKHGRMATDFGSFAQLRTTWFDVHWIAGHNPADAVVFGPPRNVFFYQGSDGSVRSVVFDTLEGLAVTLCFG